MTYHRRAPQGYTTLHDHIKALPEERKRILRRARWRLQHLLATYGWKAQRYKDLQMCRKWGCPHSFKRKYRDNRRYL